MKRKRYISRRLFWYHFIHQPTANKRNTAPGAAQKLQKKQKRSAERVPDHEQRARLTVDRLNPHVLEREEAGRLDDDLYRLLPVEAAHVALAHITDAVDRGLEGEVVGPRDVDPRYAVVV